MATAWIFAPQIQSTHDGADWYDINLVEDAGGGSWTDITSQAVADIGTIRFSIVRWTGTNAQLSAIGAAQNPDTSPKYMVWISDLPNQRHWSGLPTQDEQIALRDWIRQFHPALDVAAIRDWGRTNTPITAGFTGLSGRIIFGGEVYAQLDLDLKDEPFLGPAEAFGDKPRWWLLLLLIGYIRERANFT